MDMTLRRSSEGRDSGRIRPLLATLALLVLTVTAWAKAALPDKDIPNDFVHLTIADGLSQGSAFSILQDRRGFIWIGTEDGLNRYDGRVFKIYMPTAAPNSLSNNTGQILFEDSQGVLWIGTLDGLNRYNRETDDFTRYRSDADDPNTLSHNAIYAICEDRAGMLWLGTEGGGLNSFDRKTGKFTRYLRNGGSKETAIEQKIIYSLHVDKQDVLWIATYGGLHALDLKTGKMTVYVYDPQNALSLSSNQVRVIFEDRKGTLWVGTDGGGLNALDRTTGKFTRYLHDYKNPRSLSHNSIYAIYQDRSGNLWISTNDGLNRYDEEKNDFTVIRNDPRNPASLSYDYVVSIFEDRSGVLWIGTRGRGIDQYVRDRTKFGLYVHQPDDPNSLGSSYIRGIAEDASGNLWIGTEDKGLDFIDKKRRVIDHIRQNPADPAGLSSNFVYSVRTDPSGAVWIGTLGGGLNRYDPRTKTFLHYRHDPGNPGSLSDDLVRCLLFASRGTLWVGTDGGGLNRFVPEKGSFLRYQPSPFVPGSLSHAKVRVIFEDRSGRIWIGTFGGGLNRYEKDTDSFTVFRHDAANPNCLSNDFVMSLNEDSAGNLWIGTQAGLNRFDPKTGIFDCFTVKDGLPNSSIYGILIDESDDIWFSTNHGLVRFSPSTKTVKAFDVADGLQSNEFNGGAYYKAGNGEMFFGGTNGLNHFFPGRISDNSQVPAVVITDFQIYNKSVGVGQKIDGRVVLDKSITEADSLTLSFRHRFISFEFAALHFAAPEKNQCAYMMEGLEKEWNFVKDRRFATYSNLSPGRYTFRVKGSNNDGLWNEAGVALKIRVIPPFWKTWWFLGLVGFVITASAYSMIQSRTRNIRNRAALLEKRVQERTVELQQQIAVRKKTEEELAHRHHYLESILFNSSNAIVAAAADGAIIEWSSGAEKTFGWTRKEVLGKNIDDVITLPEFKENAIKLTQKTLGGILGEPFEAIRHRKDGTPINVILASSPIYIGEDSAGGMAVYTDITRLKKAEEAATEANRVKSEFLANMSHEIRTPMNGIFGMTELALETDLTHEQREYLEAVKVSAEALMDILNDILDYSKIEANKIDLECIPFHLRDTVHAMVSGAAPLAEKKGLELAYHIRADAPERVLGDPGRLRQVLTNLLSNALKFTNQGEIVVSLDAEERTADAIKLHFQVRDTGIGIPSDKLKLIFDPFTQADSSMTRLYGGTGLGLAISRQLVERMGGRIWAESQPGHGSIFHFTASLGLQMLPEEETAPVRFMDLKDVPVLVVDDNATNRRILHDMLIPWGLKPILAESGSRALLLLRQGLDTGSPIQLVITDANMPAMDGFELASEIKSHPEFGDLIIMMLSSTGFRGDSALCRRLGLTAYLTKPVKQSLLLDAIMLAFGISSERRTETPLITRHSIAQTRDRYSVLLAEDNVINQKLAVKILERRGHRVTVAANGEEVLAALEGGPFDAILMDVQMPKMDGFQATAEIRRREQTTDGHLPIIAMTAHALAGDRENCLEAGMDDYVSKPLKPLDLLKTIDQVIKRLGKKRPAAGGSVSS
jgi:PAS domain S-box-containing protein